jgi:hypothetical protein
VPTVKKHFLSLGLPFLCCVILAGQEKPVPPGRRELKDYQATHVDEPPQVAGPRLDHAGMQKEAGELADLAQSIPRAIDSANKGVLPKDVLEKLKRIEKISKHLRGELAP